MTLCPKPLTKPRLRPPPSRLIHRRLAAQAARLTPETQRDLALVRNGLYGGLTSRLSALRCQRFRRRTVLENLLFGFWFLTNRRFLLAAAMNRNAASAAPQQPTRHYHKTRP